MAGGCFSKGLQEHVVCSSEAVRLHWASGLGHEQRLLWVLLLSSLIPYASSGVMWNANTPLQLPVNISGSFKSHPAEPNLSRSFPFQHLGSDICRGSENVLKKTGTLCEYRVSSGWGWEWPRRMLLLMPVLPSSIWAPLGVCGGALTASTVLPALQVVPG